MIFRSHATKRIFVIGKSQQVPELSDGSVHLMVTSSTCPIIVMWDELFKADPKIGKL
jgi:hypothetical protein